MWERYVALAPTALLWVIVGTIAWVIHTRLNRYVARHLPHRSWRNANKRTIYISEQIGSWVTAPIVEEIVFRLPLIMLFDGPHGLGWVALVLTSLIFGLIHAFNDHTDYDEVMEGEYEDVRALHVVMLATKAAQRGENLLVTYVQVSVTTVLGLILGYMALAYGSITLCICAHAAWNIVVPILSPYINTAIAYGIAIVAVLGSSLKRRFKKS